MAGYHRGKNWLVKTPEGLVPRGIAPQEIRDRIEQDCRKEGKPLDNGDLAQYFATPYYVVKSWADRGVLPCHRTPSGRARFLLTDVIALRNKRYKAMEQMQDKTREKEQV